MTPTLTVAQQYVDPDTVQGWLAIRHPSLGRTCDLTPGLAAMFADIVQGMVDYCSEHCVHPSELKIDFQLFPGHRIVLDLGVR